MNLDSISLFRVVDKQLRYLGQRQETLAKNIANANTPGYQAMDLAAPEFQSVMNGVQPVEVAATSPSHFGVTKGAAAPAKEKPIVPWEISPDGNSVVLEQQMMEASSTQAKYQMATELYRKYMGMMKLALGSNRG
ncbi:MAG: flagellar basal body rod protein FlgB [Dongiaceae bacterium]